MTQRQAPGHGDDAAEQAAHDLPGWDRRGDRLVRTFVHDDFHSAALFVERVATAVAAADHHPDIAISGGRVTVTLGGPDGPTRDDLLLARRLERLVGDHHHPVGLAGP